MYIHVYWFHSECINIPIITFQVLSIKSVTHVGSFLFVLTLKKLRLFFLVTVAVGRIFQQIHWKHRVTVSIASSLNCSLVLPFFCLVRNVLSWKQHTDFRPPVRTQNATERASKSQEGGSGNQEDSQEKHGKTSDPRQLDPHPLKAY